jgi:ubiquitin-conjugating enzyme E2 D/E
MAASAGARVKRIHKEIEKMEKDAPSNCSAGPVDTSNIDIWEGTIIGPTDSPFENGIFKVEIRFPTDYPFSPPKIKFLTPLYHPNVDKHGNICLDILKADAWSPALTLPKVLLSLCSLLTDPNPDDPLWGQPADLLRNNPEEYRRIAREWTVQYAS